MLKIHQPYIKKLKPCFTLASIGAFLLGSLTIINLSSESSSVSAAEIKYMQQFTNPICQSMNPGDTMELIDARGESKDDFQTYTIIRMSNNTCWMSENLRLTGPLILNTRDTDLADGSDSWLLPASVTTWNVTISGTGQANGNNVAQIRTGDSKLANWKKGYGNYYSWCAATAGTCLENGNPIANKDAASSICPKGWQLPPNTETESYKNLTDTYKSSWQSNQTINGVSGMYGYRFGYNNPNTSSLHYWMNFWPAAGYIGSANGALYSSGSNGDGYYWSSAADSSTGNAYYLSFNHNGYLNPQGNGVRHLGFSVRCVADPEYTGNITWSEDKTGDVNVSVPSILTIDAASGLAETADASKIIEGTATATISSNTEYNVTLHSAQPSLKDSTVTTAEISPVSDTNPVQPDNNAWGFWDGTGSADTKTYTIPITTEPQSLYNTATDTTNTSGDPATLHTYYVGISISPSLPSGTYATDVIITASTK